MKFWRLPILLLVVAFSFCTRVGWARATISGRKIGPVEIANIEGNAMMVSRDDRWLAFGWSEEGTGIRCTLFNRRTHKFWIPELEMLPIAFSRSGKGLFVWCYGPPLPDLSYTSSDSRYIAVYDPTLHRFSRVFPYTRSLNDEDDYVSGFLSKDGATLTIVTSKDHLYGFNTRTGKLKWRRQLPQTSYSDSEDTGSPVLSNDGKRLLRNHDGVDAQQSEVVDTRSGKVLARLCLNYKHPYGARPIADEGRLAQHGPMAATYFPGTQEWFFWNTRTSRVCWKIGGPSQITTGDLSWQFSPNGRIVGVFGPRGFQVRDAQTGRILKQNKNLHANTVAFSLDGKRLYAIGEGNDFEHSQTLWQWRLFGTRRQFNTDKRIMRDIRRREERFALSARHINQSLLIAAQRCDSTRVKRLLKLGANLHVTDGRGGTPLERAVNSGDARDKTQAALETVRTLVAHGANVNARDGSILAGASADNFALTKFLLEHGAHVNGDASAYGSPTALHSAVGFGQLSIVRLLISHGANVNAKGKDGETPLIELAKSNFTGTDMNAVTIARLLVFRGANINARDKNGRSALYFASFSLPALKKALRKWGAHS